ncbi:replication-relaxation family protein [Chengkuizengella axinellae]|uniref:Replication-relaxation family protein n=1 Tax=Chengkuizengella axinellae TaxID=3064388 RepID=A0ABT9J3G8_9BACL|nr:replication-relaxation family protein [Chengkuizengella sp. 2205SS18-9]MDP5276108.1 replication-relaxation family protein [Chengkuizengella sp. 2205SS18-9]
MGLARPNEQDFRILIDIYTYRVLSVQQLKQIHFPNTSDYHYRKLRNLYQDGLLIKDRMTDPKSGRKTGTCYYISHKGIEFLIKHGLLNQKDQPFNAARSHNTKMQRHVLTLNELKVQLTNWEWIDGRVIKRELPMENNTKIGGALKRDNDTRYVYLVGEIFNRKNPLKVEQMLAAHEKRISLIDKEIEKYQLKKVIIFVRTEELYSYFYHNYSGFASECWLLPYRWGIYLLKNPDSPIEQYASRKEGLFYKIKDRNYIDMYQGDIQILKTAQAQDKPFSIFTNSLLEKTIKKLVGPNVDIHSVQFQKDKIPLTIQ